MGVLEFQFKQAHTACDDTRYKVDDINRGLQALRLNDVVDVGDGILTVETVHLWHR